MPLEFVNSPETIGRLDNMISINNCIAVDLFGQVSAESVGTRQVSGTGGQLDYLTGATADATEFFPGADFLTTEG